MNIQPTKIYNRQTLKSKVLDQTMENTPSYRKKKQRENML